MPRQITYACAPLWAPLALFAAYPTIGLIRGSHRRVRRHCRRSKGLCITCGYDLRGSVSGVCSECGEPIDAGEPT